jgi:polyribonucleotide nucleotidyltransferase
MGRVVNVTKFGAFVNILPGRDGLVHISKLGKGKRINNVEDVLTLGQEIEVIVEEIDEKGKVSLTPGASWNPFPDSAGNGDGAAPSRRLPRIARPPCRRSSGRCQLRRRVRRRAGRRARRPGSRRCGRRRLGGPR